MSDAPSLPILPYIPDELGSLESCEEFGVACAAYGEPSAIYPYIAAGIDIPRRAFYVVHWNARESTLQKKKVLPYAAAGSLERGVSWWVSGLPSVGRPLWNSVQLHDPEWANVPVLVVEGEKTAQAAARMFPDWVVVTSAGGSSAAHASTWPLRNRDVIIACDYDGPGVKYAETVAQLAKLAGAQSIQELRWSPFVRWKIEDGERKPRAAPVPKTYDLADLEQEGWTREHLQDGVEDGVPYVAPYTFLADSASDLTFPNEGQVAPYCTVGAGELLCMHVSPREYLLGSWLTTCSSNMIFAPRGVGKSFLTLNIALAVAQGRSFLTWKNSCRAQVVYVDGEMINKAWQERLTELGLRADSPFINNLRFITYDSLDMEEGRRVPDLGNVHHRHRICASLTPETRLLVLDNISALTQGVDENDALAWEPIAEWVEYLKHQYKVAVLFVHHSGKGGDQRGTSKREDAMDTVIALRRPSDYQPSEGARFDIEFTKGRTVSAEEARGLQVHLKHGTWHIKDTVTDQMASVAELYSAGAPIDQIARELRMPVRRVYQSIEEQVEMGVMSKRTGRRRRRDPEIWSNLRG